LCAGVCACVVGCFEQQKIHACVCTCVRACVRVLLDCVRLRWCVLMCLLQRWCVLMCLLQIALHTIHIYIHIMCYYQHHNLSGCLVRCSFLIFNVHALWCVVNKWHTWQSIRCQDTLPCITSSITTHAHTYAHTHSQTCTHTRGHSDRLHKIDHIEISTYIHLR